jgi:hypothetical protein
LRRWEEWLSLLWTGQPIGELELTDDISLQHEPGPCILSPGGTTSKHPDQKPWLP